MTTKYGKPPVITFLEEVARYEQVRKVLFPGLFPDSGQIIRDLWPKWEPKNEAIFFIKPEGGRMKPYTTLFKEEFKLNTKLVKEIKDLNEKYNDAFLIAVQRIEGGQFNLSFFDNTDDKTYTISPDFPWEWEDYSKYPPKGFSMSYRNVVLQGKTLPEVIEKWSKYALR